MADEMIEIANYNSAGIQAVARSVGPSGPPEPIRHEMTMTKEELLKKLEECGKNDDIEDAHETADGALLAFINDPDISEAFNAIDKRYA